MLTPDPELAVEYGIFSTSQAREAGITRAELARGLRHGRWERRARGVLQAVGREPRAGDELLCAILSAGAQAAAGFSSAAAAFGWELPAPPTRPELIVPTAAHLTIPATVQVYRCALSPGERTIRGVLPLTTPARTVLDVAASTPTEHAVVVIDSALRCGAVSREELETYFAGSRRHGVRAARAALMLADPASGIVPESQARLLFRRGGLPAPVSQFPVFVAGALLARIDFAWPWAMLAGEIDGFAYHSLSGAFQRDRDRQNALVQAGWRVLRFTVDDIRRRDQYVLAQVRQALDEAS